MQTIALHSILQVQREWSGASDGVDRVIRRQIWNLEAQFRQEQVPKQQIYAYLHLPSLERGNLQIHRQICGRLQVTGPLGFHARVRGFIGERHLTHERLRFRLLENQIESAIGLFNSAHYR